MTSDQIKEHVIDFAVRMANDGAEPADQLTAINLLVECSLKAIPVHQRTKIGSILFDTIRANL